MTNESNCFEVVCPECRESGYLWIEATVKLRIEEKEVTGSVPGSVVSWTEESPVNCEWCGWIGKKGELQKPRGNQQ